MPSFNQHEQKSPSRRFLLILGLALFICITTFGLMIIFWDKLAIALKLTQWNRYAFGILFIIYGLIRSARIYKKDVNE